MKPVGIDEKASIPLVGMARQGGLPFHQTDCERHEDDVWSSSDVMVDANDVQHIQVGSQWDHGLWQLDNSLMNMKLKTILSDRTSWALLEPLQSKAHKT
jgi:hypothetical protein